MPNRLLAHFTIPVPPSSKNARRARMLPTGRLIQFRPKHVVDATATIKVAAQQAMAKARTQLSQDSDLCVMLDHHVGRDEVEVRVWEVRPRPDGKTGRKRDVINLPELVCDAMQDVVYANDRQVSDLIVRRIYEQA